MKYTKVKASNGRTMYYRDGKLISRKDVPEREIWRLEGLAEEQIDQILTVSSKAETVDNMHGNGAKYRAGKRCIFCYGPATTSRFINTKTAELCESDYFSHTTGEVAEQMRKNGTEALSAR